MQSRGGVVCGWIRSGELGDKSHEVLAHEKREVASFTTKESDFATVLATRFVSFFSRLFNKLLTVVNPFLSFTKAW